MIAFYRVWAVVIRHVLLYPRGIDKLNQFFYWPLVNIILFGLTAFTASKADPAIVAQVLAGLACWQVMQRIAMEVATLLQQELLSDNIVNLLSTPLTFAEWVMAGVVLGFITLGIVSTCCAVSIYFLFNVMLWKIGLVLLPLLFLLTLCGLFFGFIICGIFMLMGLRAIDLMFSIIWLFMPFSAAFAPLSVMPAWIQKIAYCMPFAYVFETLRTYQITGELDVNALLICFVLTIIFCAGSVAFFWWAFRRSKDLGIARLS